jgi:hypothetical protein
MWRPRPPPRRAPSSARQNTTNGTPRCSPTGAPSDNFRRFLLFDRNSRSFLDTWLSLLTLKCCAPRRPSAPKTPGLRPCHTPQNCNRANGPPCSRNRARPDGSDACNERNYLEPHGNLVRIALVTTYRSPPFLAPACQRPGPIWLGLRNPAPPFPAALPAHIWKGDSRTGSSTATATFASAGACREFGSGSRRSRCTGACRRCFSPRTHGCEACLDICLASLGKILLTRLGYLAEVCSLSRGMMLVHRLNPYPIQRHFYLPPCWLRVRGCRPYVDRLIGGSFGLIHWREHASMIVPPAASASKRKALSADLKNIILRPPHQPAGGSKARWLALFAGTLSNVTAALRWRVCKCKRTYLSAFEAS